MLEIAVGTGNPHKLEEIRAILAGLDVRLRSLAELGVGDAALEDRPTLEGNAARKALFAAERTGLLAIADDTGLEVDALGGEPGVLSARWSGPGATYADNNRKLLAALEGVRGPARSATFRCVMAAARPAGDGEPGEDGTRAVLLFTVEGRCRGEIATGPRGEGGFGYDPLFVVEGLGRAFAELAPDEKNRLSHRARALGRLRERLAGLTGPSPPAAPAPPAAPIRLRS